jgi:hypothetical protein
VKASNIKGHCQACGRIQVVGAAHHTMVNHGYKVRSGYFQGVCVGNNHPPLEVSREHLDYVVAYLGREALMHTMKAERLQSGAELPPFVINRSEPYGSAMYHSRHHEDPKMRGQHMTSPWHQGSKMEQEHQLKMDIEHHQQEARFARSHAQGLVELAAKVHGQPLIDRTTAELVKRDKQAAKTAPIAGAFRTKAAQKDALEALNRAYSKQHAIITDHYLSISARAHGDAGHELYYSMPHDLHNFRQKHAALIRELYPQFEGVIWEISRLFAERDAIKRMPVIK